MPAPQRSQSTIEPFHAAPPADWPPLTSDAYATAKAFAAEVGMSMASLRKQLVAGGSAHHCTAAHPLGGIVIHRQLAKLALEQRATTHPHAVAMRTRPDATAPTPSAPSADDGLDYLPASTPFATDSSTTAPSGRPLTDHELLLKAKLAKEQYGAKLVKLEFERADLQSIAVADAQLLVFNAAREARNILTALPDRLSSAFAVESDPHVIRETLRTELDSALEEIASAIAKLGDFRA